MAGFFSERHSKSIFFSFRPWGCKRTPNHYVQDVPCWASVVIKRESARFSCAPYMKNDNGLELLERVEEVNFGMGGVERSHKKIN